MKGATSTPHIQAQGPVTKVQVLYQLCREGKLEHPHMIDVEYPTHQNGLRLKDVKKRLNKLRGKGMSESFAWSYKRSYKNAYIWRDLTEKDVILPLQGTKEYVLKASELHDAYNQDKAEHDDKEEEEEEEQQQLQLAHSHHRISTKPSKLISGLVINVSTQQKTTVNPVTKQTRIGSNALMEPNQKSMQQLDSLEESKPAASVCSRKHESTSSCKSSSSEHSSVCENSIQDIVQRKTSSSHTLSEVAAAQHVNAHHEKPADFCFPSCDGGFLPQPEERKEVEASLCCEFAVATSAAAEIPLKARNWKREVPGKRIFFRGNNRSRVSNSQISPVFEVGVERKNSHFPYLHTTHEDVGLITDSSKQQPFLEECYPSFTVANVASEQNLFAVQAQNEVQEQQNSRLNLGSVWARWCCSHGWKFKGLVTKSSSETNFGKRSKKTAQLVHHQPNNPEALDLTMSSPSETSTKKSKLSNPMISNGAFEESKKFTTQPQNPEETQMALAEEPVLTTTGLSVDETFGATNCSIKQQSPPAATSDDNQLLMVPGVQNSQESPAPHQPLSMNTELGIFTVPREKKFHIY